MRVVRRLLLSVIGPCADLDDLAQDVFIEVHKSLRSFRGEADFSTWLHRVTVNVAISYIRKKKRIAKSVDAPKFFLTYVAATNTPHETSMAKQMIQRLYAILSTISPKCRTAFVLFEIEGLSQSQIAKVLSVSEATVKSRIWQARKSITKKACDDEYLGPLIEELNQP